jgi:hypothetical protein
MKNGTVRIDEQTKIGGPSHETLRAPFQKTLAEQAAEHKRAIEQAVREFKEE